MSVPSHFGRYRVLRALAYGEMGVVYLAEDPLIGRRLAIKSIRLDLDSKEAEARGLQERFEQEIQIAGTFSHPNIVTLFDVGRQEGRAFIAMEYVEGRNLRSELQASGPMPVDKVVTIAGPVCRALSYAHERQVIHRDIKPTNILIAADGTPKITDFGVARLFGSTLTHAGKIFGTPAYMSPEQAIGGELTGASDQFALATMAYELLTGARPFRGDSPTAVIYEVIEHEPPSPDQIAPLVPAAIGRVVMRGLSKDPAERFEACGDFAEALEEAADWARRNPRAALLLDDGSGDDISLDLEPVGHTEDEETGGLLPFRLTLAVPRNVTTLAIGLMGVATLLMAIAWAWASGGSRGGDVLAPISSTGGLAAALPDGRPGASDPPARRPGEGTLRGSGSSGPVQEPATAHLENGAAPVDDQDEAASLFRVTTKPAGATVTFDGELLADPSAVRIDPGAALYHELRLERSGYQPVVWQFQGSDLTAAHRATGELHFPLTPVVVDDPSPEADPEENGVPPVETPPAEEEILVSVEPATHAVITESAAIEIDPATIRIVRAPAQTPVPERLRHVAPVRPTGVDVGGTVLVDIEISARGNVVQAKVTRGLHPLLDDAALGAVVQWKYAPSRVDGVPVRVALTVSLPFEDR